MRLPALLCSVSSALLVLTLTQACTTVAAPSANVVAATSAKPGVAAPINPDNATALLALIKDEIGDAACSSNAQCQVMAIGAKACGGPQTYLPWSNVATKAAVLQPLVERQRTARRAEIAAGHEISTCSMMLAPSAVCNPAGHCQLQGATAATN